MPSLDVDIHGEWLNSDAAKEWMENRAMAH